MNWVKSVATLKKNNDIKTDKELKEITGLSHPNLTSVRAGSAKLFTLENMCRPFGVRLSTFVKWGEE